MAEFLENGPKNAKYSSKMIQNEIIGIFATIVTETIINQVQDVPCFSIIIDEVQDDSSTEQVAFILRYGT